MPTLSGVNILVYHILVDGVGNLQGEYFMSALYDYGFYDEADVFLDSRPLDPGVCP